jgi:hypothetical protein
VGDERVVKDIEVPVAKLNKTGQSRVRQISVLLEKVKAAAASEQAAEPGGEEPGAAEPGMSEPGSEFADAAGPDREPMAGDRGELRPRGREVREERERTVRPAPGRDRRGGPPVSPPRGRPLPAMLPPVPGGAGLFRITSVASADADSKSLPKARDDAASTTDPEQAGAGEASRR